MRASDLTQGDFAMITILERVGSSMSLLGAVYIIVTYLASAQFRHSTINRLMLYASLGNICTNISTLISRAAINPDDSINNHGLCQTQGFLIQMFMPADAYWALAMAVNVYVTFFHNFGERDLRRLEKWYFLACYGIPFIPAFAFLFVNTEARGHVYGNAVLWCWIDSRWDSFRIITFYGPVLLAMTLTIVLYTSAGSKIYAKYRQLRDCQDSRSQLDSFTHDPFKSEVEPHVYVTQSVITETTTVIDDRAQSAIKPRPLTEAKNYKIEISGGTEPGVAPPQLIRSRKPASAETNRAIMSYTKVAATLFFFMLCTWLPSSANRVYSVIHPSEVNLPLECFSALVLSLQGFWNALIYAYTSRSAAHQLWLRFREKLGTPATVVKDVYHHRNTKPHGNASDQYYGDNDSMAELKTRSEMNGSESLGSLEV